MEKGLLVSVVVPMYNVERYIERCLDSLVNQTYKNLEIILIDDGSTDDTVSIVEKYEKIDNRIKFIKTENRGVSSARNTGIERLTGDFCLFVDSDDWLEIDWIEHLVDVTNQKRVDIVISGYYINNNQKRVLSKKNNCSYEECLKMIADPMDKCGSALWNKFFSVKLIKNIYFDATLAVGEDMLFLCQAVILAENITIIEEIGYHYFIHEGSVMRSMSNKLVSGNAAYKRLDELFDKHGINTEIRNMYKARNSFFNCGYIFTALERKNVNKELIKSFQIAINNGYRYLEQYDYILGKRKYIIAIIRKNYLLFRITNIFYYYVIRKRKNG